MSDKPCVVSVNGTDYYYPCDRRSDIIVVDNYIINIGSSSITLYHNFPTYQDNTSGYPRITLPSNTKGYIRNSYQANTSTVNVSSIEWKTTSYSYSVYLLIVIIGILLLQLFRKR